jgi:hypothetical protein
MKNSQMIGSISQHLPVIVKYRFVEKVVEGLTVQDSFLLYGTYQATVTEILYLVTLLAIALYAQ